MNIIDTLSRIVYFFCGSFLEYELFLYFTVEISLILWYLYAKDTICPIYIYDSNMERLPKLNEMQQLQEDRREARRKRRVRNQILAYVFLVIFLVGATAGGYYLAKNLQSRRDQQQQQSQQSQDKLDEILASEESIAPTPQPTPEVVEISPEEKFEQMLDEMIAEIPLEDKVAGLFIVTPEAITGVNTAVMAGDGTRNALEKYAVGGLIYFQKNIESAEQIKDMLANTQAYAQYPLFLAVDEEGGKVARLAAAGIYDGVGSASEIGATGDTNNAYAAGMTIGSTLASLGFNVDFAPVADVANVSGSVMKERSYGSDAATVAGFVTAMMQGLEENGVTGCLKHFPGIGCTTDDTHNGLAFSDRSEEQFRAEELTVFQAGIDAGAGMIMVGHMSAPNLTGNNDPCIFSEKLITTILRQEMGYEGVIVTDALNMGAISNYYGADEAAIMALKAGCDMLLMPESFEKAYGGVLQAVLSGTISEDRIDDSLKRIYRIKYSYVLEEQ